MHARSSFRPWCSDCCSFPLVESYGVEAGRLQVEGLGETKPTDDNDTPEGRQNNRRVELVKLGG